MSIEAPALCPFHLALPVTDLVAAEAFYCGVLGCGKGRTASRWIDLDFYGHQVTLHLVDRSAARVDANPVDGDDVPSRHFGVVLDMPEWRALAETLERERVEFLIAPKIRFAGEPGEQATMFVADPSGNALEFKAFRDRSKLFATS